MKKTNSTEQKTVLQSGAAHSPYQARYVSAPYQAGFQPQGEGWIKLNTNENPCPPSPKVIEAIKNADLTKLRLYCDPESNLLNAAIAKKLGVEEKNVFCGNGSDEVLAHAFSAFFAGKSNVFMPDISYGFYPVWAQAYGVEVKRQPLKDDFTLDVNDYKNANGVIIANPNAPTGLAVSLKEVEKLVCNNPDCAVVVDEAYIDYSTAESAVKLISKYNNLLVVRTFSKAYSLAGLRVGFAVGNEGLIKCLRNAKDSFNSYPLDMLAQAGATAAIEDDGYFEKAKKQVIETRDWTAKKLGCAPSQTNFLFWKVEDAKGMYEYLLENKILVRYWNTPRLKDYLRISVGTKQEMEEFVKCIEKRMKRK